MREEVQNERGCTRIHSGVAWLGLKTSVWKIENKKRRKKC
jgi:hypothetical protein